MKSRLLYTLLILLLFLAGCLFKQEKKVFSVVKSGIITGKLSEIKITRKKNQQFEIYVYAIPFSIASTSNSVSDIYHMQR